MLDSGLAKLERLFLAYCEKHKVQGSVTLELVGRILKVKLDISAPVGAEVQVSQELRQTDFGFDDVSFEVDSNGSNHRDSAA